MGTIQKSTSCGQSLAVSILSRAETDDVANYIADLSGELGRLAAAKNLTFLASLLNLATLEAKRNFFIQ